MMTYSKSVLDLARIAAQLLYKSLADAMASPKAVTWADIAAAQAKAADLARQMAIAAEGQTTSIAHCLLAAMTALQAAATPDPTRPTSGPTSGPASVKAIRSTHLALLDSAHQAAHSLSYAVAAQRNRAQAAARPSDHEHANTLSA